MLLLRYVMGSHVVIRSIKIVFQCSGLVYDSVLIL